jgi:hypothetical protein
MWCVAKGLRSEPGNTIPPRALKGCKWGIGGFSDVFLIEENRCLQAYFSHRIGTGML